MDLGAHRTVILNRIQTALPLAMQKLGSEVFPITRIEAQMTASNDGDFFLHHNDNGQGEIASRELTFVYFFHREPRAFQGGELRIYDSRLENGEYCSTGRGCTEDLAPVHHRRAPSVAMASPRDFTWIHILPGDGRILKTTRCVRNL